MESLLAPAAPPPPASSAADAARPQWPDVLERLRTRLLPTDRRSPWIALPLTRPAPKLPQRLWGVRATPVWASWALDGGRLLDLQPLTQPAAEVRGEGGAAGERLARPWEVRAAKHAARDAALAHDLGGTIPPSAPLGLADGLGETGSTRAQLALWPDELDVMATAAQQHTRTQFEAVGLHPLHVVLGTVTWQERDSAEAQVAPWLAWPVHVRGERGGTWRLEPASDEPQVNAALHERLARAGLLDAWPLTPPTDAAEWAAAIAHVAALAPRAAALGLTITLTDQIWLAELSGGQDRLWADLDPSAWPGGAAGLLQPPVADLLGAETDRVEATWLTEPARPLDPDQPHPVRGTRAPQPLIAADPSQTLALWEIRDRPTSQVIVGPPGTGKSQTIVNLMADAAVRGQRVLFVAQKPAALTVVSQRLEQLGLGPFVLPLFGDEDLRDRVLRQVDRATRVRRQQTEQPAPARAPAAEVDDAPPPAVLRAWDAVARTPWGPTHAPLQQWALTALDLPAGLAADQVGHACSALAPEIAAQWQQPDTLTRWTDAAVGWWTAWTAAQAWGPRLAEARALLARRVTPDLPSLDAWLSALGAWQQHLGALAACPAGPEWALDPVRLAPQDLAWVTTMGAGDLPPELANAPTRDWAATVGARGVARLRTRGTAALATLEAVAPAVAPALTVAEFRRVVRRGRSDATGWLEPLLTWDRATRRAVAAWLQAAPAEAGRGLWAQWRARLQGPVVPPVLAAAVARDGETAVRAALRRAWRTVGGLRPVARRALRSISAMDAATQQAVAQALQDLAPCWGPLADEPLQTALAALTAYADDLATGATLEGTPWRAQAAALAPWPADAPRAVWLAHHAQVCARVLAYGAARHAQATAAAWVERVGPTLAAQQRVADLLGATWPDLRVEPDPVVLDVLAVRALEAGAWASVFALERASAQVRAAGLAALEPLLASCADGAAVAQLLEAVVAQLGWRAALDADATLQPLEDAVLEAARADWQRARASAREARRVAAVAALTTRALPPQQVSTSSSQMRGLQFLAQQQGLTRRRPLRHWVRVAGEELLTLCPIVMATPLELARHVAPDALATPFDLVVLDEASQIRPEFALGALARATRAVIVGDPRQLGPDRAAGVARSGDDDEGSAEDAPDLSAEGDAERSAAVAGVAARRGDRTLLERAESLLSAALLRWPAHLLRWHYRSRDAALMAFSNARYYEAQLEVLPTPPHAPGAPRRGVVIDRVAGHAVRRGKGVTNPLEAERVLWQLEQIVAEGGDRTVLIATFNRPQAERIQHLVDTVASPALTSALATWHARGEPLRILPLDQIQGEERDIVLISTTYAREAWDGAPPPTHFGPLGQQGGERRINVLLTRARDLLVVVTSLRPLADFRISATTGQGVRDLQAFLLAAEQGQLATPWLTDAPLTGPWRHLAAALTARGARVSRGPQTARVTFPLCISAIDGRALARPRLVLDPLTVAQAGPGLADRQLGWADQLTALGWDVIRVGWVEWFRAPDRLVSRLLAPPR